MAFLMGYVSSLKGRFARLKILKWFLFGELNYNTKKSRNLKPNAFVDFFGGDVGQNRLGHFTAIPTVHF